LKKGATLAVNLLEDYTTAILMIEGQAKINKTDNRASRQLYPLWSRRRINFYRSGRGIFDLTIAPPHRKVQFGILSDAQTEPPVKTNRPHIRFHDLRNIQPIQILLVHGNLPVRNFMILLTGFIISKFAALDSSKIIKRRNPATFR